MVQSDGGGRAVVLEAYGAHHECIDFQAAALQRSGMQVEVWTCAENRWRPRGTGIRRVVLRTPICLDAAFRLWRSPPALLAINTATGPVVRDLLCLIRPLGVATVGIFHDVEKLRSHFSSRLIARLVHARLLLADHLAQAAASAIDLPFGHVHLLNGEARDERTGSSIEIVVPGAISQDKKDLEALLALVSDPALDPRIGFTLLGRFSATPQMECWWKRCVAAGMDRRITRFTGFVPQADFNARISRCAAILPLIHPGCGHYARFRDDKISGAVNLALGARIPLLIHADLTQRWRFGPAVCAYADMADLRQRLARVAERSWWLQRCAAIAASADAQPRHQQSLYLQACGEAVRLVARPVQVVIPHPVRSKVTLRPVRPSRLRGGDLVFVGR